MKYSVSGVPRKRQAARRARQRVQACGDGFRKKGTLLAAEALQPVETAATVRVRNGKLSVTDGPFAETKEQLAGFYLIDARDSTTRFRWRPRFRRRARAASKCGRSAS